MSDHFSYDSTFISDYLGTFPQYNFGEKSYYIGSKIAMPNNFC